MVIDTKEHKAMRDPLTASVHRKFVKLKVLPAMDSDAERDYVKSSGEISDESDLAIVRRFVESGAFGASGIYSETDERVGTMFYTILSGGGSGKTLFVIGIGAHRNDEDADIYGSIVEAAGVLAKRLGCKWLRAGSTRIGAIRQLLAHGAVPVRVEFCMEVA